MGSIPLKLTVLLIGGLMLACSSDDNDMDPLPSQPEDEVLECPLSYMYFR